MVLRETIREHGLTLFALLSLVAVLPVFMLAPSAVLNAQGDSDLALEVGPETVSQQEFERRVQRRLQQMKQQQKAQGQGNESAGPSDEQLSKLVKQQVKKQMVKQLVLKVHAQKENVDVSSEELEQRWNKMVERFGSEEKLNKAISEAGETPESIRDQLRGNIRIQKFIDQNTEDPSVSDEEARSFYDENSERMQGKSFESMKPRIKQMLKQRKQKKAVQQLVETLKEETDIKVNV